MVAMGEVTVDASSRNIIESKSFKLYLNSLNQTRFTDLESVRQTLTRDLAECAEGQVELELTRWMTFPTSLPVYRVRVWMSWIWRYQSTNSPRAAG